MFLARWRHRRANRVLIDQIHGEIVAAARAPELFAGFDVPDDLDGRFEMMTLHAGLALRRLDAFGDRATDLAQAVLDRVFEGFDDALRELAISDAGVTKRLKSMLSSFHGRNKVYGEALTAGDDEALAAALAKNAYRAGADRATPASRGLAKRVSQIARALEAVPLEAFAEGRFHFPRPGGLEP